jgi:hypothetical protein
VYTGRELPSDPSITALIAQHSESAQDPRVHQVAAESVGPALDEGQRSVQVRTDYVLAGARRPADLIARF